MHDSSFVAQLICFRLGSCPVSGSSAEYVSVSLFGHKQDTDEEQRNALRSGVLLYSTNPSMHERVMGRALCCSIHGIVCGMLFVYFTVVSHPALRLVASQMILYSPCEKKSSSNFISIPFGLFHGLGAKAW